MLPVHLDNSCCGHHHIRNCLHNRSFFSQFGRGQRISLNKSFRSKTDQFYKKKKESFYTPHEFCLRKSHVWISFKTNKHKKTNLCIYVYSTKHNLGFSASLNVPESHFAQIYWAQKAISHICLQNNNVSIITTI